MQATDSVPFCGEPAIYLAQSLCHNATIIGPFFALLSTQLESREGGPDRIASCCWSANDNMEKQILHPNNRKVLNIWNNGAIHDRLQDTTKVDISLARNLFLIGQEDGRNWNFSYVGQTLENVCSGLSIGDSFLRIWAASEYTLIGSILNTVCARKQSAVLRVTAMRADNAKYGVEVLMLPIENKHQTSPRVLGVYQPLLDETRQLSEIDRHSLGQFFFTETLLKRPYLHLLVDNTE